MQEKSQQTLMTTLRSVIIAFSCCYFPLVISQSFTHAKSLNLLEYPEAFDNNLRYAFNVAMYLNARMVLSNSFMNCIIYSFSSKPFLHALRKHVIPGGKSRFFGSYNSHSKSVTSAQTATESTAGDSTKKLPTKRSEKQCTSVV